ncbi:MAG: hypothetical protein JO061_06830 [Acidobacteriaceae bacterium]|nr:hypothetical protein [Acidobacteriaceae bacterium]
MSACDSSYPEDSEQVRLRWSDEPGSPVREQMVELVRLRSDSVVISSPIRLAEQTLVRLLGKDCAGAGVIASCEEKGSCFILTIHIQPEEVFSLGSDMDPGVFAVEDFITEEQELKILKEIEKELAAAARRARLS